ncbi:MAG: hypothetical protein ACYTAF_16625, partial [Planctomycetota bacterium]
MGAALAWLKATGQDKLGEKETGEWAGYRYAAHAAPKSGKRVPPDATVHLFEFVFTQNGRYCFTVGLTPHVQGDGGPVHYMERTVFRNAESLGTYGRKAPTYEEFKKDMWKALEVLREKDALVRAVPEPKRRDMAQAPSEEKDEEVARDVPGKTGEGKKRDEGMDVVPSEPVDLAATGTKHVSGRWKFEILLPKGWSLT